MRNGDEALSAATEARQRSAELRDAARRACARSEAVCANTLRILIVEDHRESAEALRKLLAFAGHDVVVAGTMREALRACRDGRFTSLLCDIGLPDGSGLDLVSAVKALCPHIRAIALSGYGTQRDVDLAMHAGFDAHLLKPVTQEQVLTSLGSALTSDL